MFHSDQTKTVGEDANKPYIHTFIYSFIYPHLHIILRDNKSLLHMHFDAVPVAKYADFM